jgi:hypothetical protein
MKATMGVALVAMGLAVSHGARGEPSVACKELSSSLASFAGAATGYRLVYVYGAPSGWVAAGLYAVGAGLAAAGVKTSTAAICEDLESLLEEVGESMVRLACAESGTCAGIDLYTQSLVHDFLVCPSCTPDEILGAAYLVDDQREAYLRLIQRMRNPSIAGFGVLPRDQIGFVDPSVTLSYYLGLQSGIQQQQQFFSPFLGPGL